MKKFAFLLLFAIGVSGLFLGRAASNSAASAPTPTPTPPSLNKATPSPTPSFDDPNEVIKIDTELVNMTVRVVDRNNRPIVGLKQGDFKILEDGGPQQIDFFSEGEVPTNYGIVVDNSGSMRQQLDKVIEAGKVMIGMNRKDDDSLIIRFGDPDTLAAALEANEIDGTSVSAGPVYDRLTSLPDFVGNPVKSNLPIGFAANYERFPNEAPRLTKR